MKWILVRYNSMQYIPSYCGWKKPTLLLTYNICCPFFHHQKGAMWVNILSVTNFDSCIFPCIRNDINNCLNSLLTKFVISPVVFLVPCLDISTPYKTNLVVLSRLTNYRLQSALPWNHRRQWASQPNPITERQFSQPIAIESLGLHAQISTEERRGYCSAENEWLYWRREGCSNSGEESGTYPWKISHYIWMSWDKNFSQIRTWFAIEYETRQL